MSYTAHHVLSLPFLLCLSSPYTKPCLAFLELGRSRGVELTLLSSMSSCIRDRFEGVEVLDGLSSMRCATPEHSVSL